MNLRLADNVHRAGQTSDVSIINRMDNVLNEISTKITLCKIHTQEKLFALSTFSYTSKASKHQHDTVRSAPV